MSSLLLATIIQLIACLYFSDRHNFAMYNSDQHNCTPYNHHHVDNQSQDIPSLTPSPININNNNTITQDNNNIPFIQNSELNRKSTKDPEDESRDQENIKLSREERRRRRRATQKYRSAHASRERVRVGAFNVAFKDLRELLPTLPPNKKLSKIEILRLAICYISYLTHILEMSNDNQYNCYWLLSIWNYWYMQMCSSG